MFRFIIVFRQANERPYPRKSHHFKLDEGMAHGIEYIHPKKVASKTKSGHHQKNFLRAAKVKKKVRPFRYYANNKTIQ